MKEIKLRHIKLGAVKEPLTSDNKKGLCISFSNFPEWVWTGKEPVVKQ